jgi:hypothetical protein
MPAIRSFRSGRNNSGGAWTSMDGNQQLESKADGKEMDYRRRNKRPIN